VLYPFVILGTWFHEMSHGIAAILAGGDFMYLEIYSDGSGLAAHTGSIWGGLGNAFIAAAGPFGPTFAGVILLNLSNRVKRTDLVLYIFGAVILVSVLLWIRSLFGALFMILFGIITIMTGAKLSERGRRLSIQFLAVQAFTSVYLSIGYLFSSGGEINGSSFASDTKVIANNLFLPYWFWGGLILLISVVLIYSSLKKVVN